MAWPATCCARSCGIPGSRRTTSVRPGSRGCACPATTRWRSDSTSTATPACSPGCRSAARARWRFRWPARSASAPSDSSASTATTSPTSSRPTATGRTGPRPPGCGSCCRRCGPPGRASTSWSFSCTRARSARAPRTAARAGCAMPGCDLFDQFAVDLVIAGHNHCYERTLPIRAGAAVGNAAPQVDSARGTTYVTAGGGGQGVSTDFVTGTGTHVFEADGIHNEAAPWRLTSTRAAEHSVLCVDVEPAARPGADHVTAPAGDRSRRPDARRGRARPDRVGRQRARRRLRPAVGARWRRARPGRGRRGDRGGAAVRAPGDRRIPARRKVPI